MRSGEGLVRGLVLGLVQGPLATLGLSVLTGRRSPRRDAGEEVHSDDQAQEQVGAAGRPCGPGIRRCFLRLGGRVYDCEPPIACPAAESTEGSEKAETAEANEPVLPGGGYADADDVNADTQQEGVH